MVLHGANQTDLPADPIRVLEAAAYTARAASHERRLEAPAPVALAFVKQGEAMTAVVDALRVMSRRVAELEARLSQSVRADP